jgi:cell division transport system ATP-binding protein
LRETEKSKENQPKKLTSAFRTQIQKVERNIIEEINLNMKKGDFLVVVGQVGCGKTSLLYSIMGETELAKGSSKI